MTLAQVWPFIHPHFALAAACAAAVPILIHLINRRRYVTVAWGAMRFLQAAGRRRGRRARLEQWLLLAVRMAIITLLCLALARPYFPFAALGMFGQSRTHRVVIVDTSGSMAATAGSDAGPPGVARDARIRRFDRAIEAVGALIDSFPRADAVSLVTAATPAEAVVGYAAYDRRRVRDALSDVRVTARGTDLAGGLSAAAAVLAESEFPQRQRAAYLVSDMPASIWLDAVRGPPAVDAARKLAGLVRGRGLVLVQAAETSTPAGGIQPDGRATRGAGESANLAVTSLREVGQRWLTTTDGSIPEWPLRLEADLANHSDPLATFDTHASLDVQVSILDRAAGEEWWSRRTEHPEDSPRFAAAGPTGAAHALLRRPTIESPAPGTTRTKPFSVTLSTPGAYVLSVAVDAPFDDALPDDDRRLLSVEVTTGLSVLLVSGRGEPIGTGSGTYVAAALAPEEGLALPGSSGGQAAGGIHASGAIRLRAIGAGELASEPLQAYDVVILCNVARPGLAGWERLAEFVRQGGGLLLFAGDQLDVEDYNRLAAINGDGAKAGQMGEPPVAPTAPAGDLLGARVVGVVDAAGAEGDFVRFAPEPFTHPALADFADASDSGLFRARVHRYLAVEPAATGHATVLMRFTDGRPALFAGSYGNGKTMFVTTSADMTWTNLPAKGDFVSLLVSAVSWLAPTRGAHRTLTVGDVIRETLTPAESTLPIRVTPPDGQTIEGRMMLRNDVFELDYGPCEQTGAYSVSIGPRELLFAVNPDAGESDLRATDEATLRRLLQCDVAYVKLSELTQAKAGRAQTREIGHLLLCAALVLAVIESWLAIVFGASRA